MQLSPPQILNDGCLQYFDFFRLCGVCLIWSRGKVVDCLQICLFQICLFQNLSFSNLTSTTFHFPAFASDCLIGLNVFPSSSHFCSHMKFGLHSSNSGLLKTHETVRYQSCIKHAADVFCLTTNIDVASLVDLAIIQRYIGFFTELKAFSLLTCR